MFTCAPVTLLAIELENFRNFPALKLSLDPRGALLEAPNGRGKTNFLEAVHYLNLFRSFRGAPDAELASFGERGFRIRGELLASGLRRGIGLAVEGARKRLSVDGRDGRLVDHVGAALSVILWPSDIRLVQGSPSRRRRYLDVTLALSSRRYLRALQEYRRVLKQRNRLLQEAGGARAALLEPWSEQLVRHGSAIVRERLRFLRRWGARFTEVSRRLAGADEGALEWRYESSMLETAEAATAGGGAVRDVPSGEGAAEEGATLLVGAESGVSAAEGVPALVAGSRDWARQTGTGPRSARLSPAGGEAEEDPALQAIADALRDELERTTPFERRRGLTLVGPHRDDLSIHALGGRGGSPSGGLAGAERDLRRFGSQGEQRTAALALRLVESEVLAHHRGQLPIVLLDDVFSELDPGRSRELLGFLSSGQQVFLTTPKPLALELPVELPRYGVAAGAIRPLG